jgi:hypothetical protein
LITVKNLNVYLKDRLAGSIAALKLTKRWQEQYEYEAPGNFFCRLETEIRADQDTLCEVMCSLAVAANTVRETAAWAADNRD